MDTMPALFAKVRLNRGGDVYLVVDLDLDRKLVELVSITWSGRLIRELPCAAIHELVEGPPG